MLGQLLVLALLAVQVSGQPRGSNVVGKPGVAAAGASPAAL